MTSGFDWSKYSEPEQDTQPSQGFNWDNYEQPSSQPTEKEEKGLQTLNRYLGQIPSALLFAIPGIRHLIIGGEIASQFGAAEALQELEDLEERFPGKIDREKYLKAVQQAQETGPNLSNIAGIAEDVTGLPFRAKTKGQNIFRNALMAGGLQPGSLAQQGHTALKFGAYQSALEQSGIPEPISELMAFAMSQYKLPGISNKPSTTAKTPKTIESVSEEPPSGPAVPPEEPPSSGPSAFETTIGPLEKSAEELPSEYDIGRRVKQALQQEVAAPETKAAEAKTRTITPGPAGKTTAERPPPQASRATLEKIDQVGNEVSPNRFSSDITGGKATESAVNTAAEKEWENVGKLYETSRELNRDVSDIRADLADEMQSVIDDINSITGKPSAIEADIRDTANSILRRIAEIDPETGQITGYKEVNNESLIRQIQSINKKRSFEYTEAVPANAFNRLTDPIYQSVESAAERISPEAYEANRLAREAYREFTRKFDDPKIKPFRSSLRHDYPEMFKSTKNYQTNQMLNEIFSKYPQYKETMSMINRDLVQSKMKPFLDNPSRVGNRDYVDAIAELKDWLGPQIAERVDRTMRGTTLGQRPVAQMNRKPLFKFNQAQEKAAETLVDKLRGMSEEQIAKKMGDISFLKQLEPYFDKVPGGAEQFKELKQSLALDRLYEGKVNPQDKVESIAKMLNRRNDVAYLKETIGLENVNTLRSIVKSAEQLELKINQIEAKSAKAAKTIKQVVKLVIHPVKTAKAGAIRGANWLIDKQALAHVDKQLKTLVNKDVTKMTASELENLTKDLL